MYTERSSSSTWSKSDKTFVNQVPESSLKTTNISKEGVSVIQLLHYVHREVVLQHLVPNQHRLQRQVISKKTANGVDPWGCVKGWFGGPGELERRMTRPPKYDSPMKQSPGWAKGWVDEGGGALIGSR
jgi:hypothetical protein